MIVLDTNVISELARLTPDPGVLSWLDSLEVSGLVTTAVTAAELRYGVARLPDGHRKRELAAVIRGRQRNGIGRRNFVNPPLLRQF